VVKRCISDHVSCIRPRPAVGLPARAIDHEVQSSCADRRGGNWRTLVRRCFRTPGGRRSSVAQSVFTFARCSDDKWRTSPPYVVRSSSSRPSFNNFAFRSRITHEQYILSELEIRDQTVYTIASRTYLRN